MKHCGGNAALWKAEFEQSDQTLSMNLTEADSRGRCSCEDCIAWDPPQPSQEELAEMTSSMRRAYHPRNTTFFTHSGNSSIDCFRSGDPLCVSNTVLHDTIPDLWKKDFGQFRNQNLYQTGRILFHYPSWHLKCWRN